MRTVLLATLLAHTLACGTCPTCPTCTVVATPPAPTCPPVASSAPPTPPVASTAPKPPPTPPALQKALENALDAIGKNDMPRADKELTTADGLTAGDAHLAFLVARVRATRFAYAGDFEHAAATYNAVIPVLAKHPELVDEFWAHNAMMMVRAAQGDPAAALAENDQATLAAQRGTWNAVDERELLAFQKDRWHRAYLTRMLAESRTGSVKQALVGYAQAALEDYRPKGFPDSVAILDAYFAALDGRKDAALAAAKRVDPAKDDDIEDLYLVVVGLEAGGDHAAAEAVRRIMRESHGVHSAKAIMLRWIDLDAKGKGFTPWHSAHP